MAFISGLDDYGISERQLYRLGRRKVVVEVHLNYPPYVFAEHPLSGSLLRKSPAARRELLYDWFDSKLEKIEKELPLTDRNLKPFVWIGNKDYPAIINWGAKVTLPARELKQLGRLREVESLRIKRISGMRRRRRRSRSGPVWYAVQGRFAWAVDGQTKGLQTYEDRIIVLKARSVNEARKRALREFRDYEHVTLLETGYFHRFRFEKILEICGTMGEELSPKGTEVFSILRKRRMKPEFVWDPKREVSRKGKARRG